MVELRLSLIDQHTAAIDTLTERIEEVMAPFRVFRDLICTIPGIGVLTADVIIAEIGGDMTVFRSPGQLASWAGGLPRASRVRWTDQIDQDPSREQMTQGHPRRVRAVDRPTPRHVLEHQISEAGQDTREGEGHRRHGHSLLTLVWTMLTSGTFYEEPGPEYYARRNPQRSKNHAIQQLEAVGYDITPSTKRRRLTHQSSSQWSWGLNQPASRGHLSL